MCKLFSTLHRRATALGLATGTAFALVLSVQSGALAEANPPAPTTKAVATKQLGPWTIDGWKRGNVGSHCSAERPVRGATSGGGSLQFALIRYPGGYRFALGSGDWELQPQTMFPVELIAPPVLQTDGKAIAVTPKVVIIGLGSDGQLMQKLATLPSIEIKTAQAVFKLPLDGFGEALAEAEACLSALKMSAPNPSAANENTPKRPAAAPKGNTPVASPADAAPAKTSRVNTAPATKSPLAAATEQELVEERTFLTYKGPKGTFRLEALVVRPAKADGRLPIALITHGKNLKAEENQGLRADLFLPQARDFAARGWLSVVVIRRGYGQSDGIPGVSRGAAYMSCQNADLVRGFDIEADDLDAALKVIAARPDADGSRVIAVGQSLGGGTVLAFAARNPAGLIGVINVSGGVWRTDGNGGICDFEALTSAMATFGARTRAPTLWLYAENDSLFPPDVVARMHAAYTEAGGRAKLWTFPPIMHDGHNLFADFSGRVKWLRAVDRFMQANRLPNTNVARVEEVMNATKLANSARPVVEEYFSTPMPKLLVVTASRKSAYWVANPSDITGARKRALANCTKKSGGECTVVMENNDLIRRVVTGSLQTDVKDN